MTARSFSAKQKGATLEQIEAVKDNFEKGPFTEAEKMGFRCTERLHRSAQEIDDQFYGRLKSFYNDAQIIELTATAAAFEFFPRFVDVLRIPATPVPEGILEKKD